MTIWFTSDNHFFHHNVIRLCHRPFENVAAMHKTMIENWNKRVKSNEHIYVVGDFSFRGVEKSKEILDQLNGYKILIWGNHDMPAHKALKAGFDEFYERRLVKIGNIEVMLCHFPFLSKDPNADLRYPHLRPVDQGQWLIHGHVHTAWKFKGHQINVGVDQWEFAPVSHHTILARMEFTVDEEARETLRGELF